MLSLKDLLNEAFLVIPKVAGGLHILYLFWLMELVYL